MPDAAGSLYRVTLGYTVSGEQCATVLYMRATGIGVAAAGICLDIRDFFIPALRPCLATDTIYRGVSAVEVVRVGAQDSAEELFNITGNASSTQSEAPQLAVCIQIRTGLFGRTRRGRWFQGGVPDTSVLAGKLSGTIVTTIETALTALQNRYCGTGYTGGMQLGVFSRTRYAILSNPFDDYWVPARNLSANSVLSTMRSRKPVTAL